MKLKLPNLRELVQQTQSTSQQTESSTQVRGGSFAQNVVTVNSATAALSVAAWHRAMELRCNTMAMLVMQYQKRNDKAHGGNYEMDVRADGKRLNYLLQIQPNPTMTWATLVKQAEYMRVHQGNAVIYVERNSVDEVKALWLCNMAQLFPSGMIYYLSYNGVNGPVNRSNVPAYDVIHLRNTFSTDNGLNGVSTLRYAKPTLTLAATNDKLVTETAAKGMRQKLIVQEDKSQGFGLGRANKKELEKVTSQLESDIADKDVILLTNVASVTPISTNLQQQEINEIRKYSTAEVARMLGVPLIMLMDGSNSSYKSPEAATQEFLMRTIAPLSNDWEQELNAKLLGMEGYPTHRFHFDDASLMRLDPMGRANIGKVLLETGVKCVNELRADYDLPAVKDGDIHYVSTNLAELGSDKLKGGAVAVNDTDGGEEGGEA